MAVITLTTDFGLSDPFVGIMKGVLLAIAPDARLVDLTHDIPPQDVRAGALALEAAVDYFPPETIHLAVVDPGVGTARAAVAIEAEGCLFVGPDNGLFTAALARRPLRRAVDLTATAYHLNPASATFHGRDIFAPAVAHLAAGVPLEALGNPISSLIMLPFPRPVSSGAGLELHVLHVDRFGNLITDLDAATYAVWAGGEKTPIFRVGEVEIRGLCRTYGDVAPGEPAAYFGSGGRLEIGVRNGRADVLLGMAIGGTIRMDT